MSGVDPIGYMQELSVRLKDMTDRAELEEALDELEYLFEVIPPELQDHAETLIGILRSRLAALN